MSSAENSLRSVKVLSLNVCSYIFMVIRIIDFKGNVDIQNGKFLCIIKEKKTLPKVNTLN